MNIYLCSTMKLIVQKICTSHPGALGFVTVAATTLHLFLNVIVLPRAKDATSFQFSVVTLAELAFYLFIYALLISTAVLLSHNKLLLFVCYLAAFATTYASCFVAAAVKNDRLIFPSGSHREIAGIYQRQDMDFDVNNRTPHLVLLDEQCHPPNGCECWILIDPDHRSAVENDLGGWRQPTASIFPPDMLPISFAIVNVRVLDSSAYSVLGCTMDLRRWIPT